MFMAPCSEKDVQKVTMATQECQDKIEAYQHQLEEDLSDSQATWYGYIHVGGVVGAV